MQRIGVFSSHGLPVAAAVVTGIRRLDFEPVELYDAVWTPGGTRRDLDRVVVVGDGRKSEEIADFWAKTAEVPVVRVLAPYLHEEGRWFVGSSDPSWLPEKPASRTRLVEGGFEVQEKRRVKAQGILVLGRAAGINRFRREIEGWSASVFDRLRALTKNEIAWRPDPMESFAIPVFDGNSLPAAEPLSEALEASWLVVSDGSPFALQALIAGLPVIYDSSEPSVYSAVCEEFQRFGDIKAPPAARVERLLRGILAAQCSLEEIATGKPLARAFSPDDRLDIDADEEEAKSPKGGKGRKGAHAAEGDPDGGAKEAKEAKEAKDLITDALRGSNFSVAEDTSPEALHALREREPGEVA
jgi:hypothetical protein